MKEGSSTGPCVERARRRNHNPCHGYSPTLRDPKARESRTSDVMSSSQCQHISENTHLPPFPSIDPYTRCTKVVQISVYGSHGPPLGVSRIQGKRPLTSSTGREQVRDVGVLLREGEVLTAPTDNIKPKDSRFSTTPTPRGMTVDGKSCTNSWNQTSVRFRRDRLPHR